ncbi:hypothetical protein [Noviherbaspirillum sp.]|uniref:hypothetical protein n=1 Tax=Noviherbaspirillum sp. TaxID=1926288 RepID=UPI002FE22CF2
MIKYLAILLNLAALLVLGAVAVLVARPQAQPRPMIAEPAAPAADSATSAAMARLRDLEDAFGRLNRLASSNAFATAPLAIGVEPPPAIAASSTARAAPQPEAEPAVSLIYLSQDMRKAVVNGDLVGVGDELSNGMRVVSIDAERVVLESRGRRTTLQALPTRPVGGVTRQRKEGAK